MLLLIEVTELLCALELKRQVLLLIFVCLLLLGPLPCELLMDLGFKLTLLLQVIHVILLSLQFLGFKLSPVIVFSLSLSVDQEGSLVFNTLEFTLKSSDRLFSLLKLLSKLCYKRLLVSSLEKGFWWRMRRPQRRLVIGCLAVVRRQEVQTTEFELLQRIYQLLERGALVSRRLLDLGPLCLPRGGLTKVD